MKLTSLSLILVSYGLTALVACFAMNHASAQVTSWENSPLNYNNSPLNYQNSSLNYNSSNGVYDNSGNRIGYQTQTPAGVTNVFDNNGNRIGYSPAGVKQ